jgi:hypothetical protein
MIEWVESVMSWVERRLPADIHRGASGDIEVWFKDGRHIVTPESFVVLTRISIILTAAAALLAVRIGKAEQIDGVAEYYMAPRKGLRCSNHIGFAQSYTSLDDIRLVAAQIAAQKKASKRSDGLVIFPKEVTGHKYF